MPDALPSLLLLLAALAAPPAGICADRDELDDVLGGFEDEEAAAAPRTLPAADGTARFWDLDGSVSVASSINLVRHRSAVGTEYTGVQKLRTRLNLQLDLDLPGDWQGRIAGYGFYDWAYLAHGRRRYTAAVRDTYEWETDFQDVYLRGRPWNDVTLTVGRQVVNWGRSETLRVVDVLNPLDLREPGLADIEDLLLPLAMLRVDYHLGHWDLSAIAIPELRFDKLPPVGSDFFPSPRPGPPERTPHESVANAEWAAAASGIFHGWDVSLHFARHWSDRTHIASVPATPSEPAGLVQRHSRVTLLGSGGNYTVGSWLLKTELAHLWGVGFTVGDRTAAGPIPRGAVTRSRTDVMGGIEYYGLSETTIALEVVNRHVHDFDRRMRPFGARANALETAFRITADFWHDRLHAIALAVLFGERAQDGSLVRLSADYDLRDALVVGGGILLFQHGDLPEFRRIGRNDRVFFEIRYSF